MAIYLVCAIEGDKKQKEALVISLTHLIIKPDHPLTPIFVKCLCFIIEPRPEYPKAKFFVA